MYIYLAVFSHHPINDVSMSPCSIPLFNGRLLSRIQNVQIRGHWSEWQPQGLPAWDITVIING